jgi:hypothetical protein
MMTHSDGVIVKVWTKKTNMFGNQLKHWHSVQMHIMIWNIDVAACSPSFALVLRHNELSQRKRLVFCLIHPTSERHTWALKRLPNACVMWCWRIGYFAFANPSLSYVWPSIRTSVVSPPTMNFWCLYEGPVYPSGLEPASAFKSR